MSLLPASAQVEPGILFIGNSLTFYNTGVDSVLRRLSVSAGSPLATKRQANPGWTLQQHFNDPAAHQAIKERKWDWVVLQDLSDGTVTDRPRFETYSTRLDSVVRRAGAKTALYMTWTYVSEPQGMGDQIAAAYSSQGLALKAPTVPVGWAWQRVLDETDYAMYSDDRHPTFRGTYLVACLFFAQFTGKNPSAATWRGDLTAAEATYLQRVAWETWSQYQLRPYALPGRLEAERFTDMSGAASEPATDEGGGRNLGHLQPGDWFSYEVEPSARGQYKVECRVAAQTAAGQLELVGPGGKALDTVDLPVTGGFQAWRTAAGSAWLDTGRIALRFNVLKGGFNINWIAFTTEPVVSLARLDANPLRSARATLRFDAARGRLEWVSGKGMGVDASGRLIR